MSNPLRRAIGAFVAAGLLIGAAGCGVYSASSGRVEADRQRVAVRVLENRTSEPNLGIELTDAIILAIQEDNTLKVVDENVAGSLVFGEVIQYSLRQISTTQNLTVDEYEVRIAVALTFEVIESGERIFDRRRFNGSGRYQLDPSSETNETTARDEAALEIVKDILAQVVEDW